MTPRRHAERRLRQTRQRRHAPHLLSLNPRIEQHSHGCPDTEPQRTHDLAQTHANAGPANSSQASRSRPTHPRRDAEPTRPTRAPHRQPTPRRPGRAELCECCAEHVQSRREASGPPRPARATRADGDRSAGKSKPPAHRRALTRAPATGPVSTSQGSRRSQACPTPDRNTGEHRQVVRATEDQSASLASAVR